MRQQAFSIKSRIHSFSNAFRGLGLFFRQEHNARIHAVIAVITVVSGVLVGLSRMEWIAVFFAIGMVIATEAVNTTVEYLCDFICPEYNDKIKKIKDFFQQELAYGLQLNMCDSSGNNRLYYFYSPFDYIGESLSFVKAFFSMNHAKNDSQLKELFFCFV